MESSLPVGALANPFGCKILGILTKEASVRVVHLIIIIMWPIFETLQYNFCTILILLLCPYLSYVDPSHEGSPKGMGCFPVITCSRELVHVTCSQCVCYGTMTWMTTSPHAWEASLQLSPCLKSA